MSVEEEKKREETQESKKEEETSFKDDHHHEEKSPTDPIPEERVTDVPQTDKCSVHSCDRHVTLNLVETKKNSAMLKAWEEDHRSKAINKSQKELSAIASWENNKMAKVHRLAEEKRAKVEARKGVRLLELEDEVVKYRTTGTTPRKFLTSCWKF